MYDDVTAIIESEYGSDLELHTLARRLATSPRQLQRAYTQVGHTTFRSHVRCVRMREAARLLRSRPELSVRAIAARVGYRQPAQFAKAFRREHGVAPHEFRGQGPALPTSSPSGGQDG